MGFNIEINNYEDAINFLNDPGFVDIYKGFPEEDRQKFISFSNNYGKTIAHWMSFYGHIFDNPEIFKWADKDGVTVLDNMNLCDDTNLNFAVEKALAEAIFDCDTEEDVDGLSINIEYLGNHKYDAEVYFSTDVGTNFFDEEEAIKILHDKSNYENAILNICDNWLHEWTKNYIPVEHRWIEARDEPDLDPKSFLNSKKFLVYKGSNDSHIVEIIDTHSNSETQEINDEQLEKIEDIFDEYWLGDANIVYNVLAYLDKDSPEFDEEPNFQPY